MRDVRAIVLLAILTIAFYWKLTLTRQYTFLDSPDLAFMVLPWYQSQARAWHSGTFPLWDPYQWCGQPLLAQMQPGAAFPLNWPLFLAPLREGRLNIDLFHWHFVFMHWLAAIFMYAYCRELERTRLGSLLAACAFSFGGFIGATAWPQMMNSAIWLPLIFLFYHRAIRAGPGRAAVAAAAGCGTAIGMALLAGHHQSPLLEIATLTAVGIFHFFTAKDRAGHLRLFAAIAIFAGLVGALVLLPGLEYGSHAYRWVSLPEAVRFNQKLPYITRVNETLKPVELFGLLTPVEQGTAHPFAGLVAVALALYALAVCWHKSAVKLHACIALGGLAYALGLYSVFEGVLYALVPLVDKGRTPYYAVLVLQFGLLVLTAHGADALFLPIREQKRLIQLLLGAALVLGGAPLVSMFAANPAPNRISSPMLAAVIAVSLAALAHAASRGRLWRTTAGTGVLLLLLFELHAANATLILRRTNPEKPNHLDRVVQHRPIVDFLKSQQRPFRFHVDDQEIPHNIGDWEALEATEGYVATVSDNLLDFIGTDWVRSKLLLNQVYWVGRKKLRPEQIEVFSEPGGLKVFQDPDAFPRTWLVQSVRRVASFAEAGTLWQAPDFDPRRQTFVVGSKSKAPELGPCPDPGKAEIVSQQIHRVTARASSSCRQLLVFSDPALPGWKARVDGVPAPIYAAYGALRGVVVPPGDHVVEVVYRPLSVYLGAALSVVGLAAWLFLSRRSRAG